MRCVYAYYVPCPSKFDYVFLFFSRIIIILYPRDNEIDRRCCRLSVCELVSAAFIVSAVSGDLRKCNYYCIIIIFFFFNLRFFFFCCRNTTYQWDLSSATMRIVTGPDTSGLGWHALLALPLCLLLYYCYYLL